MKKALKVFVGLHLMIIGCTLTVLGDSPSLRWVTQAGSSGVVQGTTIANDAEGNFLIGGSLSGTAIFGSNILGSIGGSDGFVAKYSPLGICLWAKLMGGGGDDQVTAIAVESSSGNVYACGYYEGSATFGPFSITNAGVNSADVFVTKLAATGEVQWVRRGGGSHANGDFGNGITLDSSGNCYVTGTFSGGSSPGFTATFGSTTLTNRGYSDIFLAKYASDGTPLWAKQAGGNFSDAGNSICLSSLGELYVVGSFQSSATWGNVFATTNLVAGGGNSFDGFLAKYTLAGALDWVVGIGGAFNDFAYEVVPSANDGALISVNEIMSESSSVAVSGRPSV